MSTEEPEVERPTPGHAAAAAGRAALLLLIAVVLGVIVLQAMDDDTANRAQEVKTTSVTSETDDKKVTPTTEAEVAVRPPSEVIVVALNGAGVKGAAGTVTDQLKKVEYNVLSPDNTTKVVKASAVYYLTGYDEEAKAVAKTLGLAPTTVAPLPTPPPGPNIRTAKVVVVVGPDLVKK